MDPQQRIVAKAHELFMRYGIRSISMDEIATHLGISKKTIYQFFTDKDALVSAVVDIEIETNVHHCANFQAQAQNPVHEIFLAVDHMEDMLQMMNPIIVFDMQKYHPASYRKFEDHLNGFLRNVIRDNLVQGVEQELFRAEIDIDILTRFRLASIYMMFNPDYFPLGKTELAKALRETTMNFLYGVCNAKGQKLITKYNQERTRKQ